MQLTLSALRHGTHAARSHLLHRAAGSDIGGRQENIVDTFVMLRSSWVILDVSLAVFITGIIVNVAGTSCSCSLVISPMTRPCLFRCAKKEAAMGFP